MKDLDVGKLTSVDERGDRLYLIPAEVRGYFRRHRTRLHWVLLFVFLILPWTHINGLQTVLLNVPERKFALFGVLFRAHDIPLLFYILAAAALGLAFVTTIWGRVWCGWACPQTVFIETIFRGIERWTQGNYIERRRLQSAPLSPQKLFKTLLKWGLFVLVSALIGHSFMAYFIGSKELIAMMQQPPSQNQTYFWLVIFFTALTLFDFAWFREQFCVIMCPYGRLQSVLLDKNSLAIVYDVERGEPRRGSQAASLPNSKKGDCVSCQRCVEVCPTGIDIRNGLQMECIACTACVDACDEIMEKVKKPKGLIRYNTLDGAKISLLKPRAIFYLVAICFLISGLTFSLISRKPFDVTLLRGQGLPYSFVQNSDGQEMVLNQFRLHLQNQSSQTGKYEIRQIESSSLSDIQLTVAENPIVLAPGDSREWFFFLRFDRKLTALSGKHLLKIAIGDLTQNPPTEVIKELTLLGPVLSGEER